MTEEQFAAVRLYTSEEVVEKLGLEPTSLKDWITDNRVPHLRSDVERGVQFGAAHILEIGRMLPELLGGRRGGSPPAARQPIRRGPVALHRTRPGSSRATTSAARHRLRWRRWSTSPPGVS